MLDFAFHKRYRPSQRPRGLAPLEFVIALPLLLFVMALIINIGTSAAWKVRGTGAARDAVWRQRFPRSGSKPQPAGWPESASLGTNAEDRLDVLDLDEIDKPVARGPQIGGVDVNRDLLDPAQGAVNGTSSIEKQRPLLPSVGGAMNYDLQHLILDDVWVYQDMNLNTNRQLRVPVIYDMHENELGRFQQYQQAVTRVEQAVQQTNLLPLTFRLRPWCGNNSACREPGAGTCQNNYDPDWDRLRMSYVAYGQTRSYNPTPPNFSRFRVREFCTLDIGRVRQDSIDPLIQRITGQSGQSVPKYMAAQYERLYSGAKSFLEGWIEYLQSTNNPPAQQIGRLQQLLDEVTAKLMDIQQYSAGLP